jgi:transaldolase
MIFFLDTANLDELREAASWGVVSGVTTNPSLVSREGNVKFEDHISVITSIVNGPISAEVIALDTEGMVKEGRALAAISTNIVVKVPMTPEGMGAARILSDDGIPVNATLVFSPQQALLAAAAGASYVSPFVGRLDDIGEDGVGLVADIAEIFALQDIRTKILAASIRNPGHVSACALAGADVATVPFKVLKQLFHHPLTDSGMEKFLADWEVYKSRS